MSSLSNNPKQEKIASEEVYQVSLLEEKLQIARQKYKVGEVVVRKKVETKMIQIPIRRESLIIEKSGNNPEQLGEVVIGEEKVNGFKYKELNNTTNNLYTTKSNYLDITTAQELLEAIANLVSGANSRVRLEIVTNYADYQLEHQDICDRYP